MNTYTFNDGLQRGGRTPKLYLAKNGKAEKFVGQNLPGLCVISTHKYTKDGKWSNTTYTLLLAPGVQAIEFLSPLNGTWGQDIASWQQACERLGLPLVECQRVVRQEYPRTAQKLDEIEAFAASIEKL